MVPLTECYSNGDFLDVFLAGEVATSARNEEPPCKCGCCNAVAGQRKFVNQDHQTAWLVRVQYPEWRERRSDGHRDNKS